ncbi:MAG: hypothetical protein AUG89_02085 [Acidobacteria bacterium 13_1_20CM_4_56_7]|nr:MAG: hypothetical protein AUG89_02085 [Acidobacteria bacterium 13_1_20CM_4_56_7]
MVRFDDFELDLRTGELRRDGVSLNLPAQPAKILVLLVGRAGEVVTRSELAEQVWGGDTFVNFDQGLNFAVRQIRAALGDDSDTPRFIETLPKRGYRFIASVSKSETSAVLAPVAAQASRQHHKAAWRIPVALIALVAIVLSLLLVWSQLRAQRLGGTHRIESLAVLPLHNLSRDPEQEYFSDGMTDELITELAKVSTLRVISHTSVERYKQTKRTLRDIAQELGVDAVVEGTIMRSGDRVRITAQLIDARSDKHLWAESYERELGHSEGRSYEGNVVDLIRLQSEVARSITDEIAESLKPNANAQLNPDRAVTPEAYDLYLRGLYFSGRLSPDNLQKAFGYFNQAIEKDRSFAPAYAGLAESYGWAAGLYFLPPQVALQKSEVAATKALEIDPNSGMAHHAMAWVKYARYWDFPGAEREFQRAIELNRNNVTAHVWYGMYLAQRQRTAESWSEMQRAKQLDPFSSIVNSLAMTPLLTSHQYDRLIEEASLGLKTDPNDGVLNWLLTSAYEQKGNLADAIDQQEKQAVAYGEEPQRAKKEFSALRQEFSAKGERAYWLSRQKSLAATAWTDPFDIAVVEARLGESDAMFANLDKAYQQRSAALLYWEQTQPAFDRFRTDSRFQNFARHAGLVQ